ncbi:MAG: porin [Elusimicrobia bacterium]|jgi:phosphate-selective porin OprO/OprP|nr:porin [Elusimicrobiota bacterium]MBK7544540.1 porin [Elusimicrobiota bacterium]MBK7574065.1 porin [Elusimicrobiota bacterium]MBK7688988.1 porin [Elusimicrobiota bacterium]MBK8126203.1 porin [Elusimicrobiota bacterium]
MRRHFWLGFLALSAAVLRAEEPTLEQRLKALEDRLAASPVLAVGPEGVAVKSADGQTTTKLSGDLQADGRFYFSDDARSFTDTFLLRRVRPALDVALPGAVDLRVQANLVSASPSLDDAYLDIKPAPGWRARFGRFKAPFALETIQSSARLVFVERSLASGLAPVYENGLGLYRDFPAGRGLAAVSYGNGAVDGASADAEGAERKDVSVRLWGTPFAGGSFKTLSVGVAATHGREDGTTAAPRLPSFRTEGQNVFFSYKADHVAAGDRRRLSPQLAWWMGPMGLWAEHVTARQVVRSTVTAVAVDLTHRAWQVTTAWVLTGEPRTDRGVKPARPFDPRRGGWGAWEAAARASAFRADKATFDSGAADPDQSAAAARAWTGGLTWYWSANAKVQLNLTRTSFDGGATAGTDRRVERAFFTRAQVSF